MARVLRPVVSLLFLIFLAACMTPRVDVASEMTAYERAIACCTKLSEAKVQVLQGNSQTEITIDNHSQAFIFPVSGLSYFYLARLPDSNDLKLRLRSHIYSGNNEMRMFHPVVSYLDAQFQVVETLESASAHYIYSLSPPGQMGLNEEPSEEFTATVDAKNVRYLLIYTTPRPDQKWSASMKEICPSTVVPAGGASCWCRRWSRPEIHLGGSPVTSSNRHHISSVVSPLDLSKRIKAAPASACASTVTDPAVPRTSSSPNADAGRWPAPWLRSGRCAGRA